MRLRLSLAAAALVAAGSTAQAGKTDAFIEFGSIKGESVARPSGPDQHIDLLSYSFGETKRVSKVDSLTIKQNVKPAAAGNVRTQGSITVAGHFAACRVGTNYADAVMQTTDGRYELKEVVITGCAPDGLSLNYGSVKKVRVKGWDPEKKEL